MTKSRFWRRVVTGRSLLSCWPLLAALSGCTSFDSSPAAAADTHSSAVPTIPRQAQAREPDKTSTETLTIIDQPDVSSALQEGTSSPLSAQAAKRPARNAPVPLLIKEAGQTGQVENDNLDEISGLAVSRRTPGVLFALNDSGNAAELYAMSETGADLGHWRVNARNRDWEELASTRLDGKDYLVLGDTGDNAQRRRESVLYLVEEPPLDTPASTVLEPQRSIRFRYEDGPRNVEALAINDGILYLISKEPVGSDGPQASRLYTLILPKQEQDELLVARFAGKLPMTRPGLEARLVAAVAGVDLNHPTALDFDAASNTAYLLTYRHVIRSTRRAGQSWADALTSSSDRIYSHNLRQAEALAVSAGQSIWLTSEHTAAPIWALPIRPPS